MEPKLYVRTTADQVFKNCGSICIVGKVASFNAKNKKAIITTSEERNLHFIIAKTQVEVVFANMDNGEKLEEGEVVEARGFGIDNKKMTCQGYNKFGGDLDLATYN